MPQTWLRYLSLGLAFCEHQKFKNRLIIIGLSDETEPAVRAMQSPKIDYFVAIDTQGRMLRTAEVTGIPHAMLIGPQGIVRFEGMPRLSH